MVRTTVTGWEKAGVGWDVWVEVELVAIYNNYKQCVGQWWDNISIYNFKERGELEIESLV